MYVNVRSMLCMPFRFFIPALDTGSTSEDEEKKVYYTKEHEKRA